MSTPARGLPDVMSCNLRTVRHGVWSSNATLHVARSHIACWPKGMIYVLSSCLNLSLCPILRADTPNPAKGERGLRAHGIRWPAVCTLDRQGTCHCGVASPPPPPAPQAPCLAPPPPFTPPSPPFTAPPPTAIPPPPLIGRRSLLQVRALHHAVVTKTLQVRGEPAAAYGTQRKLMGTVACYSAVGSPRL